MISESVAISGGLLTQERPYCGCLTLHPRREDLSCLETTAIALDRIQKNSPGLTAGNFERFLERLAANKEVAGEKYEVLRRKLIFYFERNNSSLRATGPIA